MLKSSATVDRLTPEEVKALPESLTTEQLAAWLGTSARQITRMASQGRMPCVRIGRVYRFSKSYFMRLAGLDDAA